MLFSAQMGMGKNELDHFILIKIGLKTLDVKKRSNLAGFFSPDCSENPFYCFGIPIDCAQGDKTIKRLQRKAGNSFQ